MLKFVEIKLLKIKYSGRSIGDDIRVEVELLNRFLRIDKKVKAGTVLQIDKEIGRFEMDQKLFSAGLRIVVIEKDLLFNDVGSIDGIIKIDTSITKPQQLIYKIQIKETRSVLGKVWGKSTAVFEITLEATTTDVIKYVLGEYDGWLMVRIGSTEVKESLPTYLKVKVDRKDDKREYFTILEGVYRGKLASVKLREDGSSQFVSDIQHESVVYATYSISKKVLTLKGKKYKTVDYENAKWQKGLYDIEIPEAPHTGRLNDTIKRASTWFRIGHTGDRYLHTGQRSLGCITVVENSRWMEIYNVLIKSRKNDFMSVGVMEVVD